jgi:dolichol-phosphate mannosyltransferase
MRSANTPLVSIIFPTYNERGNIRDLICETELYLKNHVSANLEFIVVDDDSPDRTWEVVETNFGLNGAVRLIRRMNERSLASAVWSGIQAAKGEIVAWMDCDFSMPPFKLAELVNRVISRDCDICVGSRFIKGGKDIRGPTDSWIAVILSRAMNFSISLLLGHSFKDYTSGFAVARKEVFEKIKFQGDYGEYFIDFIYKSFRAGFKIVELPYYCAPRRSGVSKTGNNMLDYINKGYKYISLTLRLSLFGNK